MVQEMVQVTVVSLRKTVLDMVRLQANRNCAIICNSRMALVILLLFLGCFLTLIHPPLSYAQDKDIVLPESGIHYPGGFDANTVGVVQGKVYEFSQPESGPVRFRLESARENYTIIASPSWYWKDLALRFPMVRKLKSADPNLWEKTENFT